MNLYSVIPLQNMIGWKQSMVALLRKFPQTPLKPKVAVFIPLHIQMQANCMIWLLSYGEDQVESAMYGSEFMAACQSMEQIMRFEHISTNDNPADILTKPLPWHKAHLHVEPLLFWKGETMTDVNEDLPLNASTGGE